MNALLQIFVLEFRAAVRGRMLPLLAAAVAAWTFGLPHLLSGDGTPEGEYQLYVRYALGGACCLLAVALGASAAGTLAKDRAAKRLALTAVRPALSRMTRKQRQQVCADIAGRLYSKRKGSDRNTYAALSRASRRRPAHPMDLGKRIMAARNANYHK